MLTDYPGIITPLLFHMAVSELVNIFSGGHLSSGAATALTALIVLPVALLRYRDELRKKSDSVENGRKTEKQPTVGTALNRRIGQKQIILGVLCLFLGAAANLLWSSCMNFMKLTDMFSNTTQENLLASAFWIQLAGLGILVPLAEEVLFRGLMYSRMRRLIGTGPAIFFSAALFALYHGNMIQIIYAFPMALLLCLIYEKGKSLAYPVLFHMGANLISVLLESLI